MKDSAAPGWLIDELPDPICRYRPDSTLLYVNRAYADHVGAPRDELVGRRFLELIPEYLKAQIEEDLEAVRQLTPTAPVTVNEHRSPDSSGRIRWVQWTDKALFYEDGSIREIVAIGRDVTERREAEQRAMFLASHDPLTRLLNRRSLQAELQVALAEARRTGLGVGIVYLDVDDFKGVNDRLGHAAGDEVLVEIGRRLKNGFRPWDRVARMGGDEFVVLCTRVGSREEVDELAQRALHLVDEAAVRAGPDWEVSVGIAVGGGDDDPDALLNEADRQMYLQKQARRLRPD